MDMQIELVEATDSCLSLSVTSLHGGNCKYRYVQIFLE